MKISLQKLGRRYNRNWIFRGLSQEISFPSSLAILGANGSGKSTLLQILSGYLSPSEGSILYEDPSGPIPLEKVYKKVSFTAPYIEIPAQLKVAEFFEFHFGLKGTHEKTDLEKWVFESGLKDHKKMFIGALSSGMQQRVKLIAALGSDTTVVLLDEPSVNLDAAGIGWFRKIFLEMLPSRTIFLATNTPEEYDLCTQRIRISDYKPPILS